MESRWSVDGRQRQNPRLGKYSWRLVREEYHKMMSVYCPDEQMRDTVDTFSALPEREYDYRD